jgi:hypothetical protein
VQPAQKLSSQRSPTIGLLFGLIITLAAVLAYASYIAVQLSGLRRLQSDLVDRNRKDSLQLLRIQNDLNSIALAMRDMPSLIRSPHGPRNSIAFTPTWMPHCTSKKNLPARIVLLSSVCISTSRWRNSGMR